MTMVSETMERNLEIFKRSRKAIVATILSGFIAIQTLGQNAEINMVVSDKAKTAIPQTHRTSLVTTLRRLSCCDGC